jgi:hypothetical protein
MLLQLRRTGTYHIPRGGLFELVSAPHFLGEILEWFGFAMAADFSLAAVSFFSLDLCQLDSSGAGPTGMVSSTFQGLSERSKSYYSVLVVMKDKNPCAYDKTTWNNETSRVYTHGTIEWKTLGK